MATGKLLNYAFFANRMRTIKKSALAIIRDNKLLVVRKSGSSDYLMPGGKPEGKETAVEALKREITEELGCSVAESSLVFLGNFEDFTAEGTSRVSIELFTGDINKDPVPSSEIDELLWVSASDSMNPFLTPIVKKQIMPFLVARKML